MQLALIPTILGLVTAPAAAAPPGPPVISTGAVVAVTKQLQPEKPTVFIFTKRSSTVEKAFVDDLVKHAGDRVGIRMIHLTTGMEPVAKEYNVTETPLVLVYDRRGHFTGRSSDPDEIRTSIQKAASLARIDWVTDDDPRMREITRMTGRDTLPEIIRTMSLRPDWMVMIAQLSQLAHFSDGALTRRQKEMVATYVSALNRCKY